MSGTDIIKPLHGLRGGAALTVAIGHFEGLPGAAGLGVVLFFMLSGFLMGRLYLSTEPDPQAIWRYCVARVARVYPLFALVIVGTVAFNMLFGADVFWITRDDIFAHLLLAGAGRTVWTISVEFQFYGVFVLIWLASSRFAHASRLVIPLLIAATVATFAFGFDAGRIALVRYLHLFVAGLALALLLDRDLARWRRPAAIALPLAGLAYAAVFLTFPWYGNTYWIHQGWTAMIACFALLLTSLVAGNCWANRMLSWPVMFWLGEISFGLYLLHRHAEWIVDNVAVGMDPHFTWPFKIALSLLLAQIAYVAIEKPSRGYLRRLGLGLPKRMQTLLAKEA